jgi:hypothetical protein
MDAGDNEIGRGKTTPKWNKNNNKVAVELTLNSQKDKIITIIK